MSAPSGKLRLKKHKKAKLFQKEKARPVISIEPTPAEKAFEEYQKKNRSKRVEERVSKTHKERVEEYNKKLSELTEHFDIPRVGS
ncbi:unnamed protein product [Blepharisma stoltei]|uniref:Uncharacterized protein n=1 Tax=Blepharisma stoltei TaxID=1481888 RepID=A0AAU9JQV0_9CILI|nr:unnamed protein product [Blepharisma stoltei]